MTLGAWPLRALPSQGATGWWLLRGSCGYKMGMSGRNGRTMCGVLACLAHLLLLFSTLDDRLQVQGSLELI